MAGLTQQDGSEPMPRGTIQILEIGEQSEMRYLNVPSADAPPFFVVYSAAVTATNGYLPVELVALLAAVKHETGLRYCKVVDLWDDSIQRDLGLLEAARTIVWLGVAADDSNTAMRCLAGLHDRRHRSQLRRLWSRREGQALLALAERTIWRRISPQLLAKSNELWLNCGTYGIPWDVVLEFRNTLLDLASRGRVEHHHCAHAILGSQASVVISTTASIQEGAFTLHSQDFPPPLPHGTDSSGVSLEMDGLSSHLDQSISVIETRWMMLNHQAQPQVALDTVCEMDLDEEIARYTQLLQQIDVMEADLNKLDGLTTTIRCMQYDARTPRSSPEIGS